MKKTVSLILLVCVVLFSQFTCSAASYFVGMDSVTVVGEPEDIQLEQVLKNIAEQAKKFMEQNPNIELSPGYKVPNATVNNNIGYYNPFVNNNTNKTSSLLEYISSR